MNNDAGSSTQSTTFSFNGMSSQLASLTSATEPNASSPNQQQTSVGTFPQRSAGGSPTNNGGSPFGNSFTQAAAPPFGNPTSTNQPRFSFASLQTKTPSNTSLNQPTDNSQVQQPFGSFTSTPSNQPQQQMPLNQPRFQMPTAPANTQPFSFTNNSSGNQPTDNSQIRQPLGSHTFMPSNQQQQQIPADRSQSSIPLASRNSPNQQLTANRMTIPSAHNAATISKKLSDPPTPVSEQPSSINQEQQEAADAPPSVAEDSLFAKKVHTGLRDSNAFVVDRKDPNSPLYSIAHFDQLNLIPDLLKGVYSMGFVEPSKIQCVALPHLMGNPPRNIIAQSQSGTGKTAAFALAIISRIDPSIQCPQALILAPTFELAVQIGLSIEKMAKFLPYIKVAYAVRDPTISNRASRVRNQVIPETIVVGTPGTLEEWCKKMRIIKLDQIRMCCIDEADVMIATVNFQSCVDLVQALNPANCQVMLFSATYNDEVMDFARQIVQNPVVLRLKREKQALINIDQFFTNCYNDEHKYQAVQAIYAALTVGQAMIFCRTKRTARDLHIRMANEGHSVRELTSDLDIEQRATVITNFREGLFRVLISTNVTARGLDIDDVSLVINYDMPVTTKMEPDYETYLHRIGRCGRFGRKGYTFNLIGSEKDFQTMKQIEAYFSHPIKEISIEEISELGADEVN